MGKILVPLGYENLIGIDLSRRMLDLAREKGVYRELHQMELGEPLDFSDEAFTPQSPPASSPPDTRLRNLSTSWSGLRSPEAT